MIMKSEAGCGNVGTIVKRSMEFKDLTLSGTEWLKGNVLGSVLSDLLGLGFIEEPFYRDNENQATKLSDANYAYRKTFELDSELLNKIRFFFSVKVWTL